MMEQYFVVPHRRAITSKLAELRETAEQQAGGGADPSLFTPEPLRLGGHGPRTHAYLWGAMAALEAAGLKPRDPEASIDYTLTARGPYDPNWQYSQQVQGRLGDPSTLAKLPPREKLRHVDVKHQVSERTVELDVYAATAGTTKERVMYALATGVLGDVVLYYRDAEDPSDPTYFIHEDDLDVLNRHFEPEVESASEPSPPVKDETSAASVPPIALPPQDEDRGSPPPQPVVSAVAEVPARQNLAGPSVQPTAASPDPPPLSDAMAWRPVREALRVLRCSSAALDFLMRADAQYESGFRQTDEGAELSITLEVNVREALKKVARIRDDWMRHRILAERMKISSSALTLLIRKRGYVFGKEVTVVRVDEAMQYDAAYASSVWRAVLAEHRSE